jgi:capsular polysaccharide transport system permease protein
MNRLIHLSARTLKIALIGVPLLLYALYLGLIAADRYVSESAIAVRQSGGSDASALPGATLLLAGLGSPAHTDTLFLKEFVHSRDLILRLDQRLQLRQHFAGAGADLPFRLFGRTSQEDFIDYMRERVEVQYDDRASILRLRVQGFDSDYAQRLNQAILDESERFVNELSHRIARDQLKFAEGELARASGKLQQSRDELLAFQAKNKLLDPTLQAQFSGTLTGEMEATRARLEAELNGLLGFLNEEAYQVKALRVRIAALDRQIETERQRATAGDKKGARLNQLAVDFQALKLQAEIALDAYKLSLGAVENARIDATRKIKSLAVIEPPSHPETAEYPLVAYNLATLLAFCVLLYAIVRLVLATIREHVD